MYYLARDLLGVARAVGVGLLRDPLAALVGVGQRVPWFLVEVGVAPRCPGLGLVVHLPFLLHRLLPQPHRSPRHLLLHLSLSLCSLLSSLSPSPSRWAMAKSREGGPSHGGEETPLDSDFTLMEPVWVKWRMVEVDRSGPVAVVSGSIFWFPVSYLFHQLALAKG